MSLRKARAWGTFWTGMLIILIAVIVEVVTMAKCKYNGYMLPELPQSEYQNAYITVGGTKAYLYFVDKLGYIEVDEVLGGNIYTLGLTTADEYDESRILFAEAYTATIGGDSWEVEELTDHSGVYDIPAYAQFALPCESGPHWSNVTLLDQYGNVFIEGSDPGPSFCIRSWLAGYILGLTGKPLPIGATEPMPELPDGTWVTDYDEDVTTAAGTWFGKPLNGVYFSGKILVRDTHNGERIYWRVTVDDVSIVDNYNFAYIGTSTTRNGYIGNLHMIDDSVNDTGLDYVYVVGSGKFAWLFTKAPGTHHLKVEYLKTWEDDA